MSSLQTFLNDLLDGRLPLALWLSVNVLAVAVLAHCYSGCGLGEIVGLLIAVGLFALGSASVSITTFLFT